MQARKFYLDTQARAFVNSPISTIGAGDAAFFEEDVESIELYFLEPTGNPLRPYDYLDYSANTVKFAIGTITPAALQLTWSAITSTITTAITSLVTGGSGTNEQQKITFTPKPVSGGFALQLPSRNVTVSSVSANVFTAADHGLYDGQNVSLTSFSFTSSSVANGSSYFILRGGKDTFSLASTASTTTALTASVTSGGGTVALPAATTGNLPYNASAEDVQNAFVAAGLTVNSSPQILVTGSAGSEYTLTYANGSANRDYANVALVGSTLAAATGLSANVNLFTSEIASLVSSGATGVKMEVEVTSGTRRQTYQRAASLSANVINSVTTSPASINSSSFTLLAPDASAWIVSIDNDGLLTAEKQ